MKILKKVIYILDKIFPDQCNGCTNKNKYCIRDFTMKCKKN